MFKLRSTAFTMYFIIKLQRKENYWKFNGPIEQNNTTHCNSVNSSQRNHIEPGNQYVMTEKYRSPCPARLNNERLVHLCPHGSVWDKWIKIEAHTRLKKRSLKRILNVESSGSWRILRCYCQVKLEHQKGTDAVAYIFIWTSFVSI